MRVVATVSLILFALGFFYAAAMPADMTGEKRITRAVTADTVWNADKQAILAAKQRCADTGGRELEECFADAMQGLGASPEAVAFTRSFGGGAFVRRFRETGRVDIAEIVYPFRANENHGILLANGEPPVVDVDDIALLPKEAMEQDRTYGALRKISPRVTLWPGDRLLRQAPLVETLPGGGQAFVIPYTLRNFCHACEVLGSAFFAFDFDKGGKLTGIRFLRVELPPKKPPKNEARKEREQISFVVMAEEGKEFTVRLNSNRTTGYLWRPAGPLEERIVKLVRCEYVPFEGALLGGGGEEICTFLAVGRGSTEITMEYVRPWEKTHPPAKTAAIMVSVRPASSRW
jgi:inhibitor of cysteine peptidase